ncbi:unnamed protein product [Orchesella dallaii]|uniref:Uncharacterized protein n=1 Tax=Orchesella dallaii TaxID=48710 RepID=A0ABP1RLD4_9HEXA
MPKQMVAHCVSVYIHGSEELNMVEMRNDKNMCIKYVILSSSFGYNSPITREVSRYAELSSIILLPAVTGYYSGKSFNPEYIEKVVYDVFDGSFRLSVHCLFLIVDNGSVFNTNVYYTELEVQSNPANMALVKLTLQEKIDGRKVVVHYLQYLCDGYCPQHWIEGHTFGELLPTITLHKKNLYEANFRLVSYGYIPSTSTIPDDVVSFCLKIVATLSYVYCDSHVMVIASLEKLHNFSSTIYNLRNKSRSDDFFANSYTYIQSPSPSFRRISHVSQGTYSHDTSKFIFYCSKESRSVNKSKILHWFRPFTPLLWLYCFMLLAVPFVVTFISTKSVSDSVGTIYGVVVLVLGQYTGLIGKKLLIFASFFGLIVGSFYESQITSEAIVQLPPETIHSLQELLQKGYKILGVVEDVLEQYKQEFIIRNLMDKFNESWYIYGSGYVESDRRITAEANLLATQKYAKITNAQLLWYNLIKYSEHVRKQTGIAEYDCFMIPDEIVKRQVYWRMTVKNRYWLGKSIHRVQEAGLTDVWDGWVKWLSKLNYIMYEQRLIRKGTWLGDSLFHKKDLGPGLITVQEVGGFFILALCPYITSILILVVEMYAEKRSLKVNSVQIIKEVD